MVLQLLILLIQKFINVILIQNLNRLLQPRVIGQTLVQQLFRFKVIMCHVLNLLSLHLHRNIILVVFFRHIHQRFLQVRDLAIEVSNLI